MLGLSLNAFFCQIEDFLVLPFGDNRILLLDIGYVLVMIVR